MNSKSGHEKDSSTRVGRDDPPPSGTAAGADVTSRMSGTDRVERDTHGEHLAPGEAYEDRRRVLPAKTSAAAVFALVFGLAALFCALTAILAPAAVLFGIIGLVLAVIGLGRAKRAGVTGRGVAIGGLVTALLGLLLGGIVLAGVAVIVNDEEQLNRLQDRIEQVRDDLPSVDQLRDDVTS